MTRVILSRRWGPWHQGYRYAWRKIGDFAFVELRAIGRDFTVFLQYGDELEFGSEIDALHSDPPADLRQAVDTLIAPYFAGVE